MLVILSGFFHPQLRDRKASLIPFAQYGFVSYTQYLDNVD